MNAAVYDIWVYRRTAEGVLFLLLHTSQEKADRHFAGGRFWQIPSGVFQNGESVPEAFDRYEWLPFEAALQKVHYRGLKDGLRSVVLVQEIRRACEQSSALTRHLLSFSRKEVPAPRAIDLNTLVEEARSMLKRLLGERIRVDMELEHAPLIVRADPGQIQQVLMNLVVNARDAMPNGGTLTLRTRAEQPDNELAER